MGAPVGDGDLPSGTVTFLFTDIEGSTPLWDAHPAAMRDALARHDEILKKAIENAEGYVFSTGGDGFAAVFSRAGNAVTAALEAQRGLTAEPWPDDVELRVRMGLHTGEVQERDGDYFGPPVNRAARLMGAANGGQIVVSALTAALLDDSAGVSLIDLGDVQLKGVVELVHVFGVEAPDAAWIDRPLISLQTTAGNLPRPQTELVGDLADLQRRVSTLAEARLVTLTGSGGVGKTRTAVEIGWLVVDEFVGGVWLVELAPIADPEVVIAAVASTLSIQPQAGTPLLETVVDWFVGRRLLLIIDNCEHMLAPVMELLAALVEACPTVTIIATSREPLGLPGERVIRIPSLDPSFGVELFCSRAASADNSFTPSTDDVGTIEAICDRLDGIPLAIELAAARARSLSPEEVLARLGDRFRLLRGNGRGGLERHQTLRAAVTWSYQLLSDDDRLLFDRLSVFAGGFDLEAAERVCGGDDIDEYDIDEYDIVDLIGELVDKSMIIAERTGATTRYRLLETLRQYGEERLADRGETAVIRDRHLDYYCRVAETIDPLWTTPAQLEADALGDREWDNFRAAHGWALTTDDATRATDLLWGLRSYTTHRLRHEAGEWSTRTLDLNDRENLTDGRVFVSEAAWAFFAGDFERAHDFGVRAIESATDEAALAGGHFMRLYGLGGSGRLDEAASAAAEAREVLSRTAAPHDRLLLRQALIDLFTGLSDTSDDVTAYVAAANEMGGPAPLADASRVYGNMLLFSTEPPDIDGAIESFATAISLADQAGSNQTGSWARLSAAMALEYGNREGFADSIRETIRHAAESRHPLVETSALEVIALHLASRSEVESAAVILGWLEQSPPGFRQTGKVRDQNIASVAGLADLDTLKATGAVMSKTEIVAYALAQIDQ